MRTMEKIYPFIEGFDGKYGFGKIVFAKTTTAPSSPTEGTMYYDDTANVPKFYNGSSWVSVEAAATAGTGLDGNYDLNRTITVDSGAFTLAANGSIGMTITQATNYVGLYVNNTAGTGNAVDIQNAGTGYDIEGSDNSWHITKAGVAVFTGVSGFGNLTTNDITATDSSVSITTDATSGIAVALEMDTLTTGTALEIDADAGAGCKLLDLQNGSSSVLTVGGTGIVTIAGSAEGTSYLTITAGDLTLTDGDLVITQGNMTIIGDALADVIHATGATTGNYDVLELDGTTNAGSGHILKILQGAGARTGNCIDVAVGATAVASKGLNVSSSGGTRTQSLLNVTDAGTGASSVTLNTSGAVADNKAILELVLTGTPAAAGSNALRVDGSGITATNVPTLVEIIGSGKTVQGLNIDADPTSVPVVLINGGGALTNGLGVVNITNDGNLATGGNVLNITAGGTPHAAAATVEIVSAKDCYALDITTSAATNSAVQITGIGAVADDKALLSVIHSTGTMASGGSLVRIAGSTAATATAYGMTINCDATNLEALWVEAGTVLIAETCVVTGGVSTKVGSTANLTSTPTDAEFSTAFGVANKTRGGFMGVVVDSGDAKTYFVCSNGATWQYVALTVAT